MSEPTQHHSLLTTKSSSFYFRKYQEAEDCGFTPLIRKKEKAIIAALLGTVVERYDCTLYSYLAIVLSNQFFPSQDTTVSLIKFFAAYAFICIAKPVGSYIFGTIGDKIGRKHSLRWNILGVAIPTFLIGCLPTYHHWRWVATALLVLFRMLQSMFVTAESDGVSIFMYETLPKTRSCLANSLNWVSDSLGCYLAAFVASEALMPHYPSWSWRVPFLLSGVLGIFTFWFRRCLMESYDYTLYRANKSKLSQQTFGQVLWSNRRVLILAVLIMGSMGGTYSFYLFFWNSYLHQVVNMFSAVEASRNAAILMGLYVIGSPLGGYLADYIKPLRTFKIAIWGFVFMIAANCIYLHHFNVMPCWLMLLTAASLLLFHIPTVVICMRMFKIEDRFRCTSMAHALGAMIFWGTTPLIATSLHQCFKTPLAPLVYCAMLAVMGFVAAQFVTGKPDEAHEQAVLNQLDLEEALLKEEPEF